MSLIGKRRVAAAVVAAAVACLSIAGSAVSASASVPVLYASANQEAHQCTVIGTDYWGNEGVVCADLIANLNLFGQPEAVTQLEIICQNSAGAERACAEVHAYGQFGMARPGPLPYAEFDCGHQWGPCPAGREYFQTGALPLASVGSCLTSPYANYWSAVFGLIDGTLFTRIELPGSGKWVYLDASNANDSGNQSSGHYQVCP